MTTIEQQIRAIQTQGVFPIGIYFGQSITDIMVSDPGYCDWIRRKAVLPKFDEIYAELVIQFNTRPLRELQAYKKACEQRLGENSTINLLIKEYVREEMDK